MPDSLASDLSGCASITSDASHASSMTATISNRAQLWQDLSLTLPAHKDDRLSKGAGDDSDSCEHAQNPCPMWYALRR